MGKIKISKSQLSGKIVAPPSKSQSHRVIISACLADGVSYIKNISFSKDVLATIRCMTKLGADVKISGDTLIIKGITNHNLIADLDCGESGSTLRFLLPVAAALGATATFIGHGKLPNRPIVDYLNIFRKHNVTVKTQGGLPLKIRGQLSSGKYEISGNVSSQYISGLLFALPLLKADSEIILTSPLESKGYVDMTIATLMQFGIVVKRTANGFFVKGGQRYLPCDTAIEGDWSQAAFFLVGGALNGEVSVSGLSLESAQGDRAIFDIIKKFGGDISFENGTATVKKSTLKATTIDCTDIPDLVPIIAVMGAYSNGLTTLQNIERLRYKESDRVEATIEGLRAFGFLCGAEEKNIAITSHRINSNFEVDGYNDHRIVMAFAIAGTIDGDTVISDCEAINKSYPDFFMDLKSVGGIADAI